MTPAQQPPVDAALPRWSSRKLWMTISSIGLMWLAYEGAMRHLELLPVDKMGPFVEITKTVLWGIISVCLSYVGITGVGQIVMRRNGLGVQAANPMDDKED